MLLTFTPTSRQGTLYMNSGAFQTPRLTWGSGCQVINSDQLKCFSIGCCRRPVLVVYAAALARLQINAWTKHWESWSLRRRHDNYPAASWPWWSWMFGWCLTKKGCRGAGVAHASCVKKSLQWKKKQHLEALTTIVCGNILESSTKTEA